MFKKLFILFALLLIWLPPVVLAATSNDKPISPSVASSGFPNAQTSAPASNPKPDTNSNSQASNPSPLLALTPNTIPPPSSTPSPEQTSQPVKSEPLKFALTFDDGPNPVYTPQVLPILEKFGARVTFFMVGQNFTRYPELVKQVAASGNEIGAHSMTHPDPVDSSDSKLDYEITDSVTLLREMSGQPIHYFRTPYGKGNDVYTNRAPELGVKIVYWTVDPRDWSGISSDAIAERVLANLSPGCIVILHDGVGNSQATVDALENILREATARGYNSLTLSELGI